MIYNSKTFLTNNVSKYIGYTFYSEILNSEEAVTV